MLVHISNITLHHIPEDLHTYLLREPQISQAFIHSSSAWKGLSDCLPFAITYQASVSIEYDQ